MNKQELVDAIAAKTGLTKKDVGLTLDAVIDIIKDELASGGNVALHGFGTFSVKSRAARPGRNPKTGESIDIAAKNAAHFSPAKALKDAMNT